MIQVIRYLKGYLSIKVWGFSTERFMNLCGNHNIFLWEIENHGDYYTMCISLKGFFQLKSITRKTGTRVAITRRYGLPFLFVRMKKRKIFIAGLAGSFLFWIWTMGHIWSIHITGNFYVTQDVFMDFLKENQIQAGMKKKEIDIEALEKAVRNEYNIVTWTSVQLDGTRLIIQIKENDVPAGQKEKQPDTGEGYDLVAEKDGRVISIITRSGVPLVAAGAEVKKGDVLVEGAVPIFNEDATVKRYEYCLADADIILESSCSVTEEIKEKYEEKKYTGRQKNRICFMLGETEIMLPLLGKKYEQYDILEEKEQLVLFENYKLPVIYGKVSVREYEKYEKIYTKEEIKIQFQEKIQKLMQTLEEKGVQIIEKNVTINKAKGTWKMNAVFTVTEKTGVLQKTQRFLPENEEMQEFEE